MNKIHINFGFLDTKKSDIREYFEKFGEVESVELPENRHFGYITFKKEESVDEVFKEKDHKINDSIVKIHRYNKSCANRIHECKHCGKIFKLTYRRGFGRGSYRRRRRGRGRFRGRIRSRWNNRRKHEDNDEIKEEFENE